MGPRFLDIPCIGDVMLEWPSDTRGRTYIDAQRIHENSFAVWVGSFHVVYDPPRKSPAWVLAAVLFVLAWIVPNPFVPTETDNALREAMGLQPQRVVSHGEYAQLCAEWPMLTMCRTATRTAGELRTFP